MFLNTFGVDILKDCHGVPSIAHRYMMQTKSEKLYTPTKEVFEATKKRYDWWLLSSIHKIP